MTTFHSSVVRASTASYKLVQSSSGSTFFDSWDFFTAADPTHGLVTFLSQSEAESAGLAYTTKNGTTVMKVDDETTLGDGEGRKSVRISSKEKVKIGSVVLLDVVNIPYGKGVWPAFWTVGDNWPNGGEIDILEGVHDQRQNQYTLHTAPGCTLTTPMQATATILETNCDANVNYNSGCGVHDRSVRTFGKGFNRAGGGLYAMSWDESGISFWVMLRNAIPQDIKDGKPNPAKWGKPRARFDASSCDMNKYFGEQTMVFDITLCGDWAGATFAQSYPNETGTCNDAVKNPKNFSEARFEVNSVKVYQKA